MFAFFRKKGYALSAKADGLGLLRKEIISDMGDDYEPSF